MRRRLVIAIATSLTIAPATAFASDSQDDLYDKLGDSFRDMLNRCINIADRQARLSCYDADAAAASKAAVAANATSANPAITVADFIVDKDKYMGRRVRVIGVSACIGGSYCMLAQADSPMTTVGLLDDDLSRSDRRRLLECSTLDESCKATVTGIAKSGPLGPAIKVEGIEWNSSE